MRVERGRVEVERGEGRAQGAFEQVQKTGRQKRVPKYRAPQNVVTVRCEGTVKKWVRANRWGEDWEWGGGMTFLEDC